jgi:hypothetical protein
MFFSAKPKITIKRMTQIILDMNFIMADCPGRLRPAHASRAKQSALYGKDVATTTGQPLGGQSGGAPCHKKMASEDAIFLLGRQGIHPRRPDTPLRLNRP